MPLTVPPQRGIPSRHSCRAWQACTESRGLLHMGGPYASGAQDKPAGFQGFADRGDAGRQLADLLCSYRGQDALVMGIARGGVAVAAAVSRSLGTDLDVLVSRKVGVPIEPELALGAVTADGAQFMNQALARELGVSEWMFRVLANEQCAEARRCEQRLRGRRPAPHLLVGQWSWSTTAWRPGRPCGRRSARFARPALLAWWWPSRWPPGRPARRYVPRLTN